MKFDTTIEGKIKKILSKMTLEQKVGQMTQAELLNVTPEEVRKYHIGSVLSGGGSVPGENKLSDWVEMNDEFWESSTIVEDLNLKIPPIYGIDAIHGNNNVKGAVIFPHNIGLGAANDPDMIERIGQITAKEVLASGLDWTFGPTIGVARNDHWGRTYECYSEDSKIVADYSERMVKGLQNEFGDAGIVACAKHWAGDGATVNGVDQGHILLSEEELRRIHVPAYIRAIEAGVQTVMIALMHWNWVKCHGHQYLITGLLKEQLKFDGFTISDWDGVNYVADNYYDATMISTNAGLDMFMISERWKEFIENMILNVEEGRIPMERIDDAVSRILRVKLRYGLLDKPRPSKRFYSMHECFGSAEHRDVAREAVRKSLVLLKNEKNILPLSKDSRILVAGKNANDRGNICGGFTVDWQGVHGNDKIIGGTSIWEGIKEIAPNAELDKSKLGYGADPKKHDAAIVVIGEEPYAEMMGDVRKGDYWTERTPDSPIELAPHLTGCGHYSQTLDLEQTHPMDLQTIKNITDRGVPVIVVLISGRPLVVNSELELSTAFVAAWLPGSEGKGVGEVLFGDYDFKGKLTFSWPGNDDENWNVGDENYNPLFPYGYGLTYSTSQEHHTSDNEEFGVGLKCCISRENHTLNNRDFG